MGSFFVEPLFALRFGREPLQEIVGLIADAGQQIELHLHPEWIDELPNPPVRDAAKKRPYLATFTPEDQQTLISVGRAVLEESGVDGITAFRAGSFGMNRSTLGALAANGIFVDSSYNQCQTPVLWGEYRHNALHQPTIVDGIVEYPVTVFRDYPGHLRPLHLSACSFMELRRVLTEAIRRELHSVVIVSHGTELMNQEKTGPDYVVYRRFVRLCRFLQKHSDDIVVRSFRGLDADTIDVSEKQPPLLSSSPAWAILRMGEQLWRTRYG